MKTVKVDLITKSLLIGATVLPFAYILATSYAPLDVFLRNDPRLTAFYEACTTIAKDSPVSQAKDDLLKIKGIAIAKNSDGVTAASFEKGSADVCFLSLNGDKVQGTTFSVD